MPYCSCILSPIIIQCNNFSRFSQLDFTKWTATSKEVYELELSPATSRLVLDNNLNLTGIKLISRVILRNIGGFSLKSNPFRNFIFNNSSSLFIYESKIETIDENSCDWNLTKDRTFTPIFSAFEYIQFGKDLEYTKNVCPLIFKNSKIQNLEIYYLNATNRLSFLEMKYSEEELSNFGLVKSMRIYSARQLVIDRNFLNRYVFSQLQTLDLDYSMVVKIEEDTFYFLKALKSFILNLDNFQEFIQSSTNKWMKNLNTRVYVDYEIDESVEQSRKSSLMVTFNSRNDKNKYDFPSKDQEIFQHFPHDHFVVARILSEVGLPCTKSLEFLLKNARYYKPLSNLNTTSAYNCLLDTTTLAPISTTPIVPTTMKIFTEESNTYSQDTFLATTITLSCVAGLACITIIFFLYKYVSLKTKVDPKPKHIG